MRRLRSALVILGLLLVFTLLTAYLSTRSAGHDFIPDHASFRTNEWGTKALRELCERGGLITETYQRPWDEFDPASEVLLCIFDPSFGPQQHEVESLVEWVKSGGHVLLAVEADRVFGSNPAYRHINANQVLLAQLGLLTSSRRTYRETTTVKPVASSPAAYQVAELLVNSSQRLVVASSSAEIDRRWRKLVGDRGDLPTITLVTVDERVPLLRDNDGVLVMRLKVGRGMIDVLSDADMLANAQIGQADNAILAMNLIYSRGAPAAVYFDEYHHGQWAKPFPGERLRGTSLLGALVALFAGVVIYLTGSIWRFGQPVPLPAEPRRSLAEHIDAFAGLYQGAQATGVAVAKTAQQFRMRLAHLTGLGPSASPQDLALAVGRTADVDVPALTRLLTELQSIDSDSKFPDATMMWLVRRIADFEEALSDGR